MSDIVVTLPQDASAAEIARVREAFPNATFEAPTAPPSVSMEDQVAATVSASRALPDRLAEAWVATGGWELLLWLAIALAAGYAAERLLRALLLDRLARPAAGAPAARFRDRTPGAFRWLLTRAAALLVFAVVATLVGRALPLAGEEARVFGRGLLSAVLFARMIVLFFDLGTAPRQPWRRLLEFTDEEARRVYREGVVIGLAGGLVGTARAALDAAAGASPETGLARALLALLLGLATIRLFLAIRRPFAALMERAMSSGAHPTTGWRHRLGRNVTVVFAVIAALDLTVKVLGALGVLGPAAASGAGHSMLLLVIAALLVAALRAWLAELEPTERKPAILGALAFGEGVIIVAGAVLLLLAWGIDPFRPPAGGGLLALLPALVKTAAIVVVGFALWRAVTAILVKKEPEGDHDEAPADGHGEMAVGSGDRIATIMPVLRGFALALIVLTTALTALSALGVDVGPLIASAGILGLAIGFGAQTLVTDIISGMFYLYEDAIRIGEYVESESGSGTVERISLRSATLRHPRGAVITVPFSKMGTIKNHSRDWVVMKFSFRVPADTDVEKVRKLIKNVGQQMAEDPEIKDKILAPLKSQGAIGITGRGFDIGCKFMSVPGEQFVIRRKAFVLLQRALKENGIALAGQDFDFQAIQTGSPGPS